VFAWSCCCRRGKAACWDVICRLVRIRRARIPATAEPGKGELESQSPAEVSFQAD
jgi:hypothetical protein